MFEGLNMHETTTWGCICLHAACYVVCWVVWNQKAQSFRIFLSRRKGVFSLFKAFASMSLHAVLLSFFDIFSPSLLLFFWFGNLEENMLNQLYSFISAQSMARIEELLQQDQNANRGREWYQKQFSLFSKLKCQFSTHDHRVAAASGWSDGGVGAENSPRTNASAGDDWRSAFDAAPANGPVDYRRN